MAGLLKNAYPWIKLPLIVSAPMLHAATPALAASVSQAGGIGFLAGGTKPAELDDLLAKTTALFDSASPLRRGPNDTLPFGVGFQNWGCKLDAMIPMFRKHRVAAIWLFAPKHLSDFASWAREIRAVSDGYTQVWIQVGTATEALEVMRLARPDVLVVQGTDAGGHGLRQSASIISLLPETKDALEADGFHNVPVLAAGGIVEARGVAAALSLGADGVVMGTRFLAAEEAGIAKGWQNEIIRIGDGGATTKRSTLCDRLKETFGWPEHYDGRAVTNKGHLDEEAGLSDAENVRMYKEELKQGDEAWGDHGRMVTYAGTGVGLIKQRRPAADIVEETSTGALNILQRYARMANSKF
ncbi:inosine monophosphate dehydrogenase [Aureobasidium pullulans]|nr:inosine monophosphate dehydrogenase [Aureobasidium pullulans]